MQHSLVVPKTSVLIPLQLPSLRNTPVVLVGNKCDLEQEREVTREEGKMMAENYGAAFFEVSAKTGVNIDEVCPD